LQEETGYSAKNIEPIGKIYSAPGFCNEVLYLFIAKGLIHDPLPQDEHEGIDPFPLFIDQALKMVETGEICDAKTVVLLLRYASTLKT
jgi:ADP-ribose pyrophosphatase